MNSIRRGMQVHAVPDGEKAFDASGRRLPWGYDYADTDDSNRRRDLEEKGPFGRPVRRRGFSRSKTATPARKEDALRIENMHAEDAIFNSYKAAQPVVVVREATASTKPSTLNDTVANRPTTPLEPTEVILYGYGSDQDWAALAFYEKVSNGSILEDYDRRPPHQRFDLSLNLNRSQSQLALSPAALSKRNRYFGGEHFIKVTFDSQQAADLACHRSPHPINGYLVYAEPYRATNPPPSDASIPYSNPGAQIDSQTLPRSFSTATLSGTTRTPDSESTNTVSTATIPDLGRQNQVSGSAQRNNTIGPQRSTTIPNFASNDLLQPRPATTAIESQQQTITRKRSQLAGAKRAVLLPADQAFLPAKRPYSFSLFALIALLFGGSGNVTNSLQRRPSQQLGQTQQQQQQEQQQQQQQQQQQALSTSSEVPRLQDGTFDYKTASLYWRFFAWFDSLFGTDTCGLRNED